MASTTASSGAYAGVVVKVNVAIWLLFVLATAFLGLRVFCKFKTHRGLWWDDHILIVSWALLLVSDSLTSANLSIGFGRHLDDIDPANLATIGLLSNVDSTISMLAAVLSKSSFAVTLLRITSGWTKIGVWVVIVVMNVAMDLNAIFYWVQCNPPPRSWDHTTPGTCWNPDAMTAYSIFAAAISALGDATLSLMPWKVIWSLQMKTKEKMGVAFAMSMGIFAAATAIVKCTKLPSLQDEDVIFLAPDVAIWSAAEVSTTIMAACIPVLRVLLNYIRSSAKNYESPNGGPSGSGFKTGTGAVTTVVATATQRDRDRDRIKTGTGVAVHHRPTAADLDDDSGSDKSILERSAGVATNQIVQTSEFTVEFHNQGRGGIRDHGHRHDDSEPESIGAYEMTNRGGEAM